MKPMLDPWTDARALAERLAAPDARLIVALGAESWCGKCRVFRPYFDARAAAARSEETWLWLDLEEHMEFLGDYLPEDLPELIIYDGPALVSCQPVEPTATDLEAALSACSREPGGAMIDPGIWTNLVKDNWQA